MLCEIPEMVARRVMDPVKGLAVKLRFFPAPKDVADAIADAMAPLLRQEERERRRQEFERVAGPRPENPQMRFHETLDQKFRHLNSTPAHEIADPVERQRVMDSIAARADETVAILQARNPKAAAAMRETADAVLRRNWTLRDQPVAVGEALTRVFAAMKGEPRD